MSHFEYIFSHHLISGEALASTTSDVVIIALLAVLAIAAAFQGSEIT